MEWTLEQKRRLRGTSWLLLFGLIAGSFYVLFSDGFGELYPFTNGLIGGFLISLNIAFYEFVVFTGKFRSLKFYQLLIIRIVAYAISLTSCVLVVLIVSRMIRYNLNFYEVIISNEFNFYIYHEDFFVALAYVFFITAATNFTIQMNRKMGQGVLVNFITGKYFKPRHVEKIIMFINIRHAQEVIGKKGRLSYHRYINEILFNITYLILHFKGEIYEYVENELVITWTPKNGVENANCIRLFFAIKEKISDSKEIYFERYHVVPDIWGALHYGQLIQGEIGDVKSEIVFHGDTINTASRILSECSESHPFLVSSQLVEKIEVPVIFEQKNVGGKVLRGKKEAMNLSSIFEKDVNTFHL